MILKKQSRSFFADIVCIVLKWQVRKQKTAAQVFYHELLTYVR